MTGRAEQTPAANHDHLWHPNNNDRYSALVRNRNQLTLPENSAQIGTRRIGLLRIFRAGAFFGNEIHALRIASGEDRGRARMGAARRLGLHPLRLRGVFRPGPIDADADANANPDTFPDPDAFAFTIPNPDADAHQ